MNCAIKHQHGDGMHDPDGYCQTHDCHIYSGGSKLPGKCGMADTGRSRIPATLAEAVGLKPSLPTDSAERKRWPMFAGLLRYFPAALAHVSNHSFLGNEKHNPGLPLQHARGLSSDHEDCIVRHLMDASEHPKGSAARIEELRALAWRTLALLQEECEAAGHKAAPAATFDRGSK